MTATLENPTAVTGITDPENRTLLRLHLDRFLGDLAELERHYEIPAVTRDNMLFGIMDLVSLLGNFSWNGIGVTSGEEPGSVDCVVDCFDSKKRLELMFDEGGVNIRQVSRNGVVDLGYRKRPYGLISQVHWLVNG